VLRLAAMATSLGWWAAYGCGSASASDRLPLSRS
jgi:hypothetical protein